MPIDLLIEKIDNLRKDISETRAHYGDADNGSAFLSNGNGLQETFDESTSVSESQEPLAVTPFDPDENIDMTWKKIVDTISAKYPSLAANLTNSNLKKLTGRSLEIEVNGNNYNINMDRNKQRLL